jgi:hypothetical protein
MCVESTRSKVRLQCRAIWPKTCACSLDLCIYCNKVIQHEACQNHTLGFENHMQRQRVKITRACGITDSHNPIWIFMVNCGCLNQAHVC